MKKKVMRQEIRLLTEENRQLRRYTLLASMGITFSLALGVIGLMRKH